MRSCFRKVATNILFNQKKEGEGGEVSWTESMHPVTPFAWRFARCGFLPRVPVERGCHAQDWRYNLEAAECVLQRIIYKSVETMDMVASVTADCQESLTLPSTLNKFPKDQLFCFSSSKHTS